MAGMASDFHRDPERLHVHGRRLDAVLDALVPLPELDPDTRTGLSRAAGPVLAELDRVLSTVDRAGHELAALAATLHDAAAAGCAADGEVGEDFRRITEGFR